MIRYLGIDYGLKRIGLALGDAGGRLATPLKQLDGQGHPSDDARQLRPIIEEYEIEVVVVGLPLMEDGTEGEQSRLTRKFGEAVVAELGLPVEYFDERYSSHAADHLLNQRDELTSKKRRARRDAIAAATFLQEFLDNLPDNVP